MGTQIHATENYRRVVELIRAGAIGRVTSCDCWVNKGWCCGPTGPVAAPPERLDYDLWLGPAQDGPYIADLHPANWRKYWAYGTGTLGDMGCHMLDLPVWALGLDRKRLGSVEIHATVDKVDSVACPEWTEASWAIPSLDEQGKPTDPLVLRWFDNGRMSPTAQELGAKDRTILSNQRPEAETLDKIAAGASSPNHAAQLYTAACVVTGDPTGAEAAFLSRLASRLGIAHAHAEAIRKEAKG